MSSAKKYLKALTEGSNLAKNIIDQAAAFQDILASLGNIGALKLEGKTTGELKSIIIGLAGKETLAGGNGPLGLLFSQRSNLQASEAALHTLGNTLSTLTGAESMHYLRPNSAGWDVVTTRVHNLVNAFKENNRQFDDISAKVGKVQTDIECVGLETAIDDLIAKSERRNLMLQEIGITLERNGFELLKGATTVEEYEAGRKQVLGLIQWLCDERLELTKQRDQAITQRDGAQQDRSHFEQSAFELAGKATEGDERNKVLEAANQALSQENKTLRDRNRQLGRTDFFHTEARTLLANARLLTHDASAEATLLGIDRVINRNKQLERENTKVSQTDGMAVVRDRLAKIGNCNPDASFDGTLLGLDRLIARVQELNELVSKGRTESPYTEAKGCACLLKHKSECLGTCSLPGKPTVEDTYFFGKLKEVLTGYSKPRATFDDMLGDVARLVQKDKEASESMHSAIALPGDLIALLGRYGMSIDAHQNPQDILPAVHRALDAQTTSTATSGLAACFGRDDQDLAQAIGDALSNSFERLKEFGVRVTPVQETSIKGTTADGLRIDVGAGSVTIKHPGTELKLLGCDLASVYNTLAGINTIFADNGYPLITRRYASPEHHEHVLKNIKTVVEFYASIKSGKENTPVAEQYNALVTVIERLPGFVYTGDVPADVRTCFDRNNKKNKEHSNRIGDFCKMLARHGVATGGRKYDDLLRTAEVLVERGAWLRSALIKEGFVYNNATTTDCLTALSGLMQNAQAPPVTSTQPSTGWLIAQPNECGYEFKAGVTIPTIFACVKSTVDNRAAYQKLAEERLALLNERVSAPWLRDQLNAAGFGFIEGTSFAKMIEVVGNVRGKYHAGLHDANEARAEGMRTLTKVLQGISLFFKTEHTVEDIIKRVAEYRAGRDKTESDLRASLLRKEQLMSNDAEPFLTRQKHREICEFLAIRGIIDMKDYAHVSVRKLAAFHDNFKKIEAERNTLATLNAEPRKVEFQLSTKKIKELVDEGVAEAAGKPLELLLTLANKYGYQGPCNTFEGALGVVDQLLAEGKEESKIRRKNNGVIGTYLIHELERSALYKATGTEADHRITLPNLIDDACKALRRMPAKEVAIKKLQDALEKANTERNEFRRVRDNGDNFVLRLRELLKIDGDYAGMLSAVERMLTNGQALTGLGREQLKQFDKLSAHLTVMNLLPQREPVPYQVTNAVVDAVNAYERAKRADALFGQMRNMLIDAGFGQIDDQLAETPEMLKKLIDRPTYEPQVNKMLFKFAEDVQQRLRHWGFGPDNTTSVLMLEQIEMLAKFRAEFGKVIGTVNMLNDISSLELLCKSWRQGPETSYCGPMTVSVDLGIGESKAVTSVIWSDGWLNEFTRFEPLGEVAAYARTSQPVNVVRDYAEGKISDLTTVPGKPGAGVLNMRPRHYVRYKGIYDLVEISIAELEAICGIKNAQDRVR